MDIHKQLYKLFFYVKDKVEPKYFIIGIVAVVLFVLMNLSSILWWGLLLFLAYSFYNSRKSQVSSVDAELDTICKDKPDLELCRMYRESKKKHTDLVESIKAKLWALSRSVIYEPTGEVFINNII